MSEKTNIFSLGDFLRYRKSTTPDDRSGRQLFSNTSTMLRRFILPAIFENPEQYDGFKGQHLMLAADHLSLHDFMAANPEAIFKAMTEEAIAAGQVTAATVRTTYAPALKRLLTAIRNHACYSVVVADATAQYSPRVKVEVARAQSRKGRRSCKSNSYGLLEEELMPKLEQELKAIEIFHTAPMIPTRRDRPLRMTTFQSTVRRSLLLFWGYLVNIKGFAFDHLSVYLMLQDSLDSETENLGLLQEFIAWGVNVRGNTYGWGMQMAKAALNIAKWKYASQSKRNMYRDIAIVEEIRALLGSLSKQYKAQKATKQADKEEKEMTMEQCVEVVHFLRSCCAPRRDNHAQRSEMAIMRSYLRYLLVAIFTYCPLRQREVRELELGRTLLREDGYRVVLRPEDNKTSVHREFRLVDLLPDQVIQDLDYWLDHWRPWFLDQVRQDARTRESWLATLGYSETSLVQEIQAVQTEIQASLAADVDEKDIKKLMKRLRKLNQIDTSWEQVKAALERKFVFFLLGGTTGRHSRGLPYLRENLRDIVVTAVYNASSKLIENQHPLFLGVKPKHTNPHFFRNIGTTHQRRNGDPDQREAFHHVIGNSVKEGDRTYNEMRPEEKTAAAKGWWKSKQQQQSDIELQALLSSMTPEQREKLKKLLG